ncbi:MAG: hypothetical protein AAF226_16545, partial [Verrucomicrobiota bacterium]
EAFIRVAPLTSFLILLLWVFWISVFAYVAIVKQAPRDLGIPLFVIPCLVVFLCAYHWMTFSAAAYRKVIATNRDPGPNIYEDTAASLDGGAHLSLVSCVMLVLAGGVVFFRFRKRRRTA